MEILNITHRDHISVTWDCTDLVSCDAELNGDVQRLVDDSGRRLDQGHEEQREPDDTDESEDDEAAHPVLHHLFLLLPRRVRVFLQQDQITEEQIQVNISYFIGY